MNFGLLRLALICALSILMSIACTDTQGGDPSPDSSQLSNQVDTEKGDDLDLIDDSFGNGEANSTDDDPASGNSNDGDCGNDGREACQAGYHCEDRACVADLPNGAVCEDSTVCVSGHCAQGRCANEGYVWCQDESDCPEHQPICGSSRHCVDCLLEDLCADRFEESPMCAAFSGTCIIPDDAWQPCVRYVRPSGSNDGIVANGLSWESAYADVQEAIDDAADAVAPGGLCQVWVAEGHYSIEDALRLAVGVGVYGGFEGIETAIWQRDVTTNESVLDGSVNDPSEKPPFHVVSIVDTNGLGPQPILDGLVLTEGRAASLTAVTFSMGAGLLVKNASPTIRDCTFRQNEAFSDGGAVAVLENGFPTFDNCQFHGNTARRGGAVYVNNNCYFGCSEAVYFNGCNFQDNEALEAGDTLYVQGSNVVVDDGVLTLDVTSNSRAAFNLEDDDI